MEWMLMPYRKLYRLIEGRSSRREFWMFTLFVWAVAILMIILMATVVGASVSSLGQAFNPADYGSLLGGVGVGAIILIVVFYIWLLLTGVASFAVTVRRLHDLNYSGWFLVLFYIVLGVAAAINQYLYLLVAIGWIVVMCLPSNEGSNKYGAHPTAPELDPAVFN